MRFPSLRATILVACLAGACMQQSSAPAPSATAQEGSQVAEAAAPAPAPQTPGTRTYTPMSKAELKKKLTPLQYKVTQEDGTERAFDNAYHDNKEPGLYVDIVSGEPLFLSTDKFDSGTGWPSFTRPVSPDAVSEHEDRKLWATRTEVRSKKADSHLGHVFDDGPKPTGLRYCMNSAAMRFVHVRDLEREGYGEYLERFPAEVLKKAGVTASAKAGEGSAATATDKGKATAGAKPVATETAILAGGCFWGMEDILRKLPGVLETEVGYSGGTLDNPTYADMRTGKTGHAEAIQIRFDPSRITYGQLLDTFFRMHDPTTKDRQGNDRGSQYRSAIFFTSEAQRAEAKAAIERATKSGRWKSPIVTEVTQASTFWPAEDYHQDYLEKNPGGYTCHFLRD